jgi:hypothetical protein
MSRQLLPIEQIVGRKNRPDALGTFLGWGICAVGLWLILDSYMAHRSHRFLDLWPYEAVVGLILAICGVGLAKRYAFGFWLATTLVLALLILLMVDLFAGGFDDGWGLFAAISVTAIAGSVFGYFVFIRDEFGSAR